MNFPDLMKNIGGAIKKGVGGIVKDAGGIAKAAGGEMKTAAKSIFDFAKNVGGEAIAAGGEMKNITSYNSSSFLDFCNDAEASKIGNFQNKHSMQLRPNPNFGNGPQKPGDYDPTREGIDKTSTDDPRGEYLNILEAAGFSEEAINALKTNDDDSKIQQEAMEKGIQIPKR